MLHAQARTSFAVLGAAAGTLVLALLVHRAPVPAAASPDSFGDDGLTVEARLPTASILPGAMDHDLAVTITTPERSSGPRASLSLVVVIDRSGSMAGQPLADAKRAAAHLISTLRDTDAFAIVSYSSGDDTVSPISRATPAARQRAIAALDTIEEDGGTCISCGLDRATRELAASPITGGLRRVVLISDGQANEGIYDRDELAELAARTAQAGVSISSVGVGLDFDEVTMVRLANVGRGNYHFVEDTAGLSQMFERELAGLAATIGVNAKLVLTDGPDARIEAAYGYPLERVGDHVIVPLADLRDAETRKVVLRVRVMPHATGPLAIAKVELGWQRPGDGATRHAGTTAAAEVVEDLDAVADSIDHGTLQAVERARSARALEESNQVYETHGADAARQVLELRAAEIAANRQLDAATARVLRAEQDEALEVLRTAPAAKARKVNSVRAYQLAR